MQKIIISGLLIALAFGLFPVGAVYAQDVQPPVSPRGLLHVYMIEALAEALGLDTNQLESRLENGETPYQIALALGIAAEEIPALLKSAHAKALELAVADGAITQEQADWMKSRGFGRVGGMGNGACGGAGRSHMRSGMRWQQTNP